MPNNNVPIAGNPLSAMEHLTNPHYIALPPVPDWYKKMHSHLPAEAEKAITCAFTPLIGEMKGIATVYEATGKRTASGAKYGTGVAIAPALLPAYPLNSKITITNLDNGQTIDTYVRDTGNFGPGRKYEISNGEYRLVDLPTNIADQLNVSGTAHIQITRG